MKKNIQKLSLKTDQIVNLSKVDAQGVQGGAVPVTKHTSCLTDLGCLSKYVCPKTA